MKAIILAAGKGSRLGKLTTELPKGMIKLDGESLLSRQINLFKSINIEEIIIVRGYKRNKIVFDDVTYIDNHNFENTNMIESLFCARSLFSNEIIMSYSDILFSQNDLINLKNNNNNICVSVDPNWKTYWIKRYGNLNTDIENLEISKNAITRIGTEISNSDNIEYRYIGLNKFNSKGLRSLCEIYDYKKNKQTKWQASENDFYNGYMTDIFQEMINHKIKLSAHYFTNPWLEIDSEKDLKVAEEMLKNGSFKL